MMGRGSSCPKGTGGHTLATAYLKGAVVSMVSAGDEFNPRQIANRQREDRIEGLATGVRALGGLAGLPHGKSFGRCKSLAGAPSGARCAVQLQLMLLHLPHRDHVCERGGACGMV
jgi:hypothetical protein